MRATTRPLEHDLDLNDVAGGDGFLFVRDGVGVAGRGVAARVPLADIARTLAAIEHDDGVGGVHPIALGVVPFEPGAPCELLIPQVLVGKAADGRQWVTTIDDAPLDLTPRQRPAPHAQSFSVAPRTDIDRYLAAVTTARDAVRAGTLTKAVIAREVTVSSDEPIDVHAVLLRLKATFGSSYRYSVDGFIGASPELLVTVDGNAVRSHPLAGTAPRTGDADTDRRAAAELLASEKNQIEHRVVIDMIHDTLLPWCSYLDWQPEPSIITVANVQHLGTALEGHLSDPRPNVLELVTALSPTPALGGFPRTEALALIAEAEGFTRGRYGGAVGWVDAAGDGTWAVAIRCAELSVDRRTARLVAGGGIVADSEPLSELAETQAKLQAMLSAIVRP
jgi:menaquinone-specific isochorismate synthase